MTNRGFALFFFVILMGAGAAFAQSNPEAVQLYGQGVHQFNMNRYAEAIAYFDQAEGMETQDPRVFFYRGLSHYRLGDQAAAVADYEKAAAMEQTVAGRSYSVPKALERVQGPERSVIERYRRAAKRTWEAEQNKRRQDDFLAQKEQNAQLYQGLMKAGDSGLEDMAQSADDLPSPFGAQPIQPFGKGPAVQTARKVDKASSGLSDDNIFKADVERVTVFEEPKPEPKRPPKPQDPAETGVFDFDDDDDYSGGEFDVSALTQNGGSAPRAGGDFVGDIFGSSSGDDFDDDDDFGTGGGDDFGDSFGGGDQVISPGGMVFGDGPSAAPLKESGRVLGRAFAGIFKKSGGSTTSTAPVVPDAAPGEPAVSDFDVTDDDADSDFDASDDEFDFDDEF